MTHTGEVRKAGVYNSPEPDHVEIHYTDVPPPRIAQHLLFVIVDDAPFTEMFQFKHAIPSSPPGAPPSSVTALMPQTPTLQSLANNGVRFRSVRVMGECSPTRAQVATTKYAFRNGIANVVNLNATQAGELGEFGDPPYDLPTVFNALSQAGVRTAMVGKIHQSADYNQNYLGRDGLGWQILNRFCAADTYTVTTLRNLNQTSGDLITLPEINGDIAGYYYYALNHTRQNQSEVLVDGTYSTTKLVDEAITWWNTVDNGAPAFMWLALNAVHTPLGGRAPHSSKDFPPEDLIHTTEYVTLRDAEAAALETGDAPLSFWEDQQAAMEAVDTELGRLLNSIPAAVRERLTVVYLNDNGSDSIAIPASREDLIPGSGLWNKDFGTGINYVIDNGHLKGSLYHYGTGVEMIWSGPGLYTANMIRKGGIANFCVDGVDVGRTICDYFDAAMPSTDGVSFFDAVYTDADIDYTTHDRQFQYSETFNPNGDWSARLATANDTTIQLHQGMWGWYFTPVGSEPTGRYHLIRKRGLAGVADNTWHYELYRHYDASFGDVDQYEMTNLYGDSLYDDVAADLEARIDALLASGGNTGNGIVVTLEDGTSTKIIPTANVSGVESLPVEDEDGNILYIPPDVAQTGVPVENSDTGSGDKVIPYTDVSVEGGYALQVDNGELGPSLSVKVIPCDQNAALPVFNSSGQVIPSTAGTPNFITVEDAVGGDKDLLLQAYP